MNRFEQFTQEQRDEFLVKAKEARIKKAQDRANNVHGLKLEYLDSNSWAELATKYKVRMPNNNDPVTSGSITKYIKRTGITREQFNEHYTSSSYFMANNKQYSQYAMAGLMLEIREYG